MDSTVGVPPDASAMDAGMDAFIPIDPDPDASPDAFRVDAFFAIPDAGPVPPVLFTDVTERAGVDLIHEKPAGCIIEPADTCETDHLTGGAAVGDVDGDGWTDLLLTMLQGPNRLLRNMGDGTFEDITEASGLAEYTIHGNGAAFLDVENDGDLDLYATLIGRPDDPVNFRYYFFLNDGTGVFTEEAEPRGLALGDGTQHGGTSIATGDYDRDGYIDIHVNEWLPRPVTRPHTRLLHNRGAVEPGFFDDVTRTNGTMMHTERCWDREVNCTSYAFSSAFADFDFDGWPDLVVISDFGTSRLFWNRGDGTFELGFRTAWIEGDENGMGSTIGDYDNDGDLDWFVTSIFDPDMTCDSGPCSWSATGNRMYRYDGERSFRDVTDGAGVRDAMWGWGSAFFDFDNDGDLDLVATNGVRFPSAPYDDLYNMDELRFWESFPGGHLLERADEVGLTDTRDGKGLLVFDYDEDGDQDLLVINNGDYPRLFRNDGGDWRSYLRIRLRGVTSNSEGIGARIQVRTHAGGPRQMREVGSTSLFLGQSERIAHFGLGRGVEIVNEVEVLWPSGSVTVLTDVDANQTLEITEP